MSDEKQAIERLSFAESVPHQAIEAAIHLNRYLLARPFCPGAKVLDAACGEGYGAFFMARRWGAREVHGVDVSSEAIRRARRLFADERITFHERAVEGLDDLFGEAEFDLAVSLETIEHVQDPAALLRSLRRAVRPGGAVVLSCPNDHWYYRTEEERNPFHVRKFTYDEFRALATSELGPARRWLFGTPLAGYANIPATSEPRAPQDRMALLDARDDATSLIVPGDEEVSAETCSYFVGIWGEAAHGEYDASCVLYPSLMDGVAGAARQVTLLQEAAARAERERGHAQLRLMAVDTELELLREHAVSVRELHEYAASLRRTIEDQARLVDERDDYIRVLEARVNELQPRAGELEARAAELEARAAELQGRASALEARVAFFENHLIVKTGRRVKRAAELLLKR